MKRVTASVIVALLGGMAAILAQEPRVETFTLFRTRRIERFEQSMSQLEGKGFDRARIDATRRLDANVSAAFGIPDEMRVFKAAEIVFPEGYNLTFLISTNTTDIIFSETKRTPDGTSLTTVFHTDPSLTLKGVASGTTTNTLQAIPIDGETAAAAFRGVLMRWDRALPNMIDSPFGRK